MPSVGCCHRLFTEAHKGVDREVRRLEYAAAPVRAVCDQRCAEIGEILGGKEIDEDSDKIKDILKSGDKHIKVTEANVTDVDNHGFVRMKEELESMGLVVAYKVFELPSFDVVIAIWEDKNEIPPLYVEVTVSESEA